jgi:hypothetical protein
MEDAKNTTIDTVEPTQALAGATRDLGDAYQMTATQLAEFDAKVKKSEEAIKELRFLKEGYLNTLMTVDIATQEEIRSLLELGATVQTITDAYMLEERQVRAVVMALEEEKNLQQKNIAVLQERQAAATDWANAEVKAHQRVAEAARGASESFSFEVENGARVAALLNQGYSFEEAKALAAQEAGGTSGAGTGSGSNNPNPFPVANLPSLTSAGRAGISGGSGGGGMVVNQYVNGHGDEVAGKVKDSIMREAKNGRMFTGF